MTRAHGRESGTRVAAFTRYAALGASSRMRLLQYLPALEAASIDVALNPLLPDEYLRSKYSGQSIGGHVLKAYGQRGAALLTAGRRADVLWIEKELWPWAPAFLERAARFGLPTVLDYDDAIFHNYDLHPNALLRRLYGRKIDLLMREATLVVAGNDYLADRARLAGAPRVEILPTVVDARRYAPRSPSPEPRRELLIGWIGSQSTAEYMRRVSAPLAALAQAFPIRVRMIGASAELPGVPVEHVAWSEADEARALAELDVGLMPLPDEPWERGKCGYKLIQYMACGVPVVASPVGANRRIVDHGEQGFLAESDTEWLVALKTLAADASLRDRMGRSGYAKVSREYSLASAAPRLAGWLHEVGGAASRMRA
jgi:glycosyltransferase involved in cell wall biosynthesis